jgi:endonuclease YncB( thermonuclease family)
MCLSFIRFKSNLKLGINISNFRTFGKDKNIDSNNKLIESNKMNFKCDGTDINWDDTIEFKFPINCGRVIKVYDGDTITIASKLPYNESPLYRFSVRLNGIDTPEIKGKGIDDEEKLAAKQTRDFLSNLILNKYILLENIQNEKYGRILADIYLPIKDSNNIIHINELLIRERYAVKYDGGTKKKPSSWIKYRITGKL